MSTIKEYVAARKVAIAEEIKARLRTPHLSILQVNDNPASNAYVNGKMRDAKELGVEATLLSFPTTISEDELLGEIRRLNDDASVDGIIVKWTVDPRKDVDGFHPCTTFEPCTPKGIVEYLSSVGFSFSGKNAVVLGRSNIVGKPMAKMLLARSCNVTVLHSKTSEEDKAFYLAHADLIVVAIGKMHYLDTHFTYKDTAIIVDVGINRGEDGKLHGDALPALPVALQTPVPGGVGLLTRLALMENVMEASKK